MLFMKNNDRRGIIRILEAFIAILLILGAVAIVFSKFGGRSLESQNIIETEKLILEQIANSAQFRDEAVRMSESSQASSELNNFISNRIPASYEYEFKVCELSSVCSAGNYHEVIYAHERALSSSLKQYSPKKMKLYVWRKE